MAYTKHQTISDIELKLTQAAPSDDLELEQEQIAFWVQQHLNELVAREIIEEKKKGNQIPPVYIVRDVALELNEESVADVDAEKQRIYVDLTDLTDEILDLPRDGGIVRVLDYDRNLIRMSTVEDIEDTRNLRFAKPSQSNIIAHREGSILVIEGFNTADLDFNPIMISYVPKQDILSMADAGELKVTDRLYTILIDTVVQQGKLELYGTQADMTNDGVDPKQVQYHTAISNPAKQEQQSAE